MIEMRPGGRDLRRLMFQLPPHGRAVYSVCREDGLESLESLHSTASPETRLGECGSSSWHGASDGDVISSEEWKQAVARPQNQRSRGRGFGRTTVYIQHRLGRESSVLGTILRLIGAARRSRGVAVATQTGGIAGKPTYYICTY